MSANTCPSDALDLLALGFAEQRAHVLELAAFLDRLERAREPGRALADFRYGALRGALEALLYADRDRTRAVHLVLADPTGEPAEEARPGSACGAWEGRR